MAPTWQTLLTMESPEETAGSIRSAQLQSCQQMAWISSITFVQRNADRQATSNGLCHTLNSDWPTASSLAHPFCDLYLELLYEAESAELCFIFCSARSVLYFPLENIVPEILLRIRCNKPVKVPLTPVHYGKYCTRAWSRGKYSTWLRLTLY